MVWELFRIALLKSTKLVFSCFTASHPPQFLFIYFFLKWEKGEKKSIKARPGHSHSSLCPTWFTLWSKERPAIFISHYCVFKKSLEGKQTYLKQHFTKDWCFSQYFQDDWKFSFTSRRNFKGQYWFWEEKRSLWWCEAQYLWQRTGELYLH